MFRRTYYVQRAERRNDSEQAMRDTSFTSFLCILFIFIVFTCLIIIAANWRLLFLVEDEIETFNYNQNKNGKIIFDGKDKESVVFFDDYQSTEDTTEISAETTGTWKSTKTIEEQESTVSMGEDKVESTTLVTESMSTTIATSETMELTKTTENDINEELDIINDHTTKAIDETEMTDITNEMTDLTEATLTFDATKSEAKTEGTETIISTETDSTIAQQDFLLFHTTNQWYFQPRERTISTILQDTESTASDTTTTTDTIDSSDATISSSNLIDLDVAETRNYPYTPTNFFTTIWGHFEKTPEILDDLEPKTTSKSIVTTEMAHESSTETIEKSTFPESFYSGFTEAINFDVVTSEYDLNEDETVEPTWTDLIGGTQTTSFNKITWINPTPDRIINNTERPEQLYNERSKYRIHGKKYAGGKDERKTKTTEDTTIIYNAEKSTNSLLDGDLNMIGLIQ